MENRIRKQDWDRAWVVGGGSYVALGRYNEAVDVVARKLNAQFEVEREADLDAPPPSPPTDQELTALRERYLEHKALEERSQSLWRMWKDSGPWASRIEDAGLFFRALYHLTVFAAAITILYRATLAYFAG